MSEHAHRISAASSMHLTLNASRKEAGDQRKIMNEDQNVICDSMETSDRDSSQTWIASEKNPKALDDEKKSSDLPGELDLLG